MSSAALKKVLTIIKPTKKELQREKNVAEKLVKTLKSAAPKGADVVLTGSVAKSTFLSDAKDIDLFVLVQKTTKKEQFEGIIKRMVRLAFPSARYELRYAEHPYARVYAENRRIDVVPAYRIKDASERISAVDRSVLHTAYILRNLKKKQIDGVLLLKKFLRTNELYGAEIRVEGFSGYLCELLIIKYGNFVNAVRAILKWTPPVFIDIKGYVKTKKEKEDAIKKFRAPLIVIDPVDRNRNVAAAVSEENLKKLAALAKRFLRTPSPGFFLKEALDFEGKLRKLKKREGALYLIAMPKPDVVDDIAWGQLKRLCKMLLGHMKENDFVVRQYLLGGDEKNVYISLLIKNGRLPPKKTMSGPLLEMKENVVRFRKAHGKDRVFAKNKRIFAVVDRRVRCAFDAVKLFIRNAKLPTHFADAKNIRIERR